MTLEKVLTTLLNMDYQLGLDFKVDKYLVNKNRQAGAELGQAQA